MNVYKGVYKGVSTLPSTSKRYSSATPSPACSRPGPEGVVNVLSRGKPNQPGAGAQPVPQPQGLGGTGQPGRWGP